MLIKSVCRDFACPFRFEHQCQVREVLGRRRHVFEVNMHFQ